MFPSYSIVMPVLKSFVETIITSLIYYFDIIMGRELFERVQYQQIIFFHEIIIAVVAVSVTDPRFKANKRRLFPGGRPHGESDELRKRKANPFVFFVQ